MKFRGSTGDAILGGKLIGSPLVQGAVAQSATSATFDAASLTGTLLAGDTFTVAGDAQEYTVVTGGAAASNEVAITFTPAVVPGAGWSDNAAVTVASNSIAQVVEWSADASRPVIEGTTMQSSGQEIGLDVPMWRGRLMVLLDYDDAKQKALIDQVLSNGAASALSVSLEADDGKTLWGSLLAVDASVVGRSGAYFETDVAFEGEGVLNVDWN